jgi:NAD(P)-dependent dehydrogenase (short-subunit alcohol dehydrogenase family)
VDSEEAGVQELADRVAFVTGGASGIGLGMARAFAERRMKLVLADVEEKALGAAVEALAKEGAEVTGVTCDVSDRASVASAAEAAEAAYGKVHVVCNNAGVSPTGLLEETSADDWSWTLGVNLMGVVHGIQELVPRIKAHGEGGHVVNTSSIAGLVALPTLGIYTATKYAVVGISETLHGELAPFGIGVSVLCPAFVRTRLADSGRNRPAGMAEIGEMPEFVAQAIDTGMDPLDVGRFVVQGIEQERLYLLTHPESKAGFEHRSNTILEAFDAG